VLDDGKYVLMLIVYVDPESLRARIMIPDYARPVWAGDAFREHMLKTIDKTVKMLAGPMDDGDPGAETISLEPLDD